MSPNPDHYLAVYGSLQPGAPNHRVVEGLHGTWSDGVVRGKRVPTGWGTALGFPAFTPDSNGGPVAVRLLHSTDLPQHWRRLDEFEGDEYRRILISVTCPDGRTITANIYVAAGSSSNPAA